MTTNLSTPSLANLAHVLRHPELWPKDFKWNDLHPHANAVKIAFLIWGGPTSYDDRTEEYKNILAKMLHVSVDDVERLLCTHLSVGRRMFGNRPDHVAERIERELRRAA